MRKVGKYQYKNSWTENLKWCTIPVLLVASLAFTSVAKATYTPPKGVITMDVVKRDGMGTSGTWVCKSLKACYTKILEAEYRGANLYCKTITMKRDGTIVWYRDYDTPYWLKILDLKSHDSGWY
jgi:hypothetical protein